MHARNAKPTERNILVLTSAALLCLVVLVYLALNEGQFPELYTQFEQYNKVVTIAVAAILLVVTLTIKGMLSRRLEIMAQLEDAARRLTNRDYSQRIHADPGTEFQYLAKAFNELTDRLQESLTSSNFLGDIDRLILSATNLQTIVQKVLLSTRMEAVDVTLLLRQDMSSILISMYRLDENRMVENVVSSSNVTEDKLQDVEGYRDIARGVCGNDILECLPIAEEDTITGVLVATSHRTLSAGESKRLTDLVDRMSVAVTNIRRSESLYQQAHFDTLTGLINRHAFEDKLKESLSRSRRGECGVLLFLDLDGFKKVNDTEGHEAGDRLLVTVSDRLRKALRPEDSVARLGGDEFAVIIPGCEDEQSVSPVCERILKLITEPIIVDRMEHLVGTSIGVALYPHDGQQPEELMMKADSAMYRAKESGGSKFAFFDDTLNEANKHRILVENRLRNALKENDLRVHFQPKLNLKTGRVDSAEALLRWTDVELGEVQPEYFVSIAEETSLIQEFMRIVVDKAALLIAASDKVGTTLDTVALNASPKQLMADGFALSLLSMLDLCSLPHHLIELEVTETVFARDMDQVVRELEILRTAGLKIALDDFGTGYSSLNMLRELPLDTVKIDRTFITEMDSTHTARMMVQHIISIASTLGLHVVAEGVETEEQLQHLRDMDCHHIQGFLISKAVSEQDFVDLLVSSRATDLARRSPIDLSLLQDNRSR